MCARQCERCAPARRIGHADDGKPGTVILIYEHIRVGIVGFVILSVGLLGQCRLGRQLYRHRLGTALGTQYVGCEPRRVDGNAAVVKVKIRVVEISATHKTRRRVGYDRKIQLFGKKFIVSRRIGGYFFRVRRAVGSLGGHDRSPVHRRKAEINARAFFFGIFGKGIQIINKIRCCNIGGKGYAPRAVNAREHGVMRTRHGNVAVLVEGRRTVYSACGMRKSDTVRELARRIGVKCARKL